MATDALLMKLGDAIERKTSSEESTQVQLNAALMAKRLREFIMSESRFDFERSYFIIDSEIVRCMIQKESYGFNTFVGLRIGEIQSLAPFLPST